MELTSDAKTFSEIFEGEIKPLRNTTKISEKNEKEKNVITSDKKILTVESTNHKKNDSSSVKMEVKNDLQHQTNLNQEKHSQCFKSNAAYDTNVIEYTSGNLSAGNYSLSSDFNAAYHTKRLPKIQLLNKTDKRMAKLNNNSIEVSCFQSSDQSYRGPSGHFHNSALMPTQLTNGIHLQSTFDKPYQDSPFQNEIDLSYPNNCKLSLQNEDSYIDFPKEHEPASSNSNYHSKQFHGQQELKHNLLSNGDYQPLEESSTACISSSIRFASQCDSHHELPNLPSFDARSICNQNQTNHRILGYSKCTEDSRYHSLTRSPIEEAKQTLSLGNNTLNTHQPNENIYSTHKTVSSDVFTYPKNKQDEKEKESSYLLSDGHRQTFETVSTSKHSGEICLINSESTHLAADFQCDETSLSNSNSEFSTSFEAVSSASSIPVFTGSHQGSPIIKTSTSSGLTGSFLLSSDKEKIENNVNAESSILCKTDNNVPYISEDTAKPTNNINQLNVLTSSNQQENHNLVPNGNATFCSKASLHLKNFETLPSMNVNIHYDNFVTHRSNFNFQPCEVLLPHQTDYQNDVVVSNNGYHNMNDASFETPKIHMDNNLSKSPSSVSGNSSPARSDKAQSEKSERIIEDEAENSQLNECRAKRPRTRLNAFQKHKLTTFFAHNQKPNKREREELAFSTQLKLRVVQVWFQNTRAARKKEAIKNRNNVKYSSGSRPNYDPRSAGFASAMSSFRQSPYHSTHLSNGMRGFRPQRSFRGMNGRHTAGYMWNNPSPHSVPSYYGATTYSRHPPYMNQSNLVPGNHSVNQVSLVNDGLMNAQWSNHEYKNPNSKSATYTFDYSYNQSRQYQPHLQSGLEYSVKEVPQGTPDSGFLSTGEYNPPIHCHHPQANNLFMMQDTRNGIIPGPVSSSMSFQPLLTPESKQANGFRKNLPIIVNPYNKEGKIAHTLSGNNQPLMASFHCSNQAMQATNNDNLHVAKWRVSPTNAPNILLPEDQYISKPGDTHRDINLYPTGEASLSLGGSSTTSH